MKLTIKDREVTIKSKMRAILIYEQITDKSFSPVNFTDMLVYLYSLILANDTDIDLTFEEFLDYIDDNPQTMSDFNDWIVRQNKVKEQLSDVKKKKKANQ